MKELPDLSKCTTLEFISIIEILFAEVNELKAEVKILKGRLALNSQNSSKPPSSDGVAKPKPKPKSERKRTGKNLEVNLDTRGIRY